MTSYVDEAKEFLEDHKNITVGGWYVHASDSKILLSHGGFFTGPKEATKDDILAMCDVPHMLRAIKELVKELEACHEKIDGMEQNKGEQR